MQNQSRNAWSRALSQDWIMWLVGLAIIALLPVLGSAQAVTFAGAQTTVTTFPSGFIYQVSVDSFGNVYTADVVRVTRIPADGGPATSFGSDLSSPVGVTIDRLGNVYVQEGDSPNRLLKYPVGGGAPVELARGFSQPTQIAVDSVGNVYVTQLLNPLMKVPVGGGSPTVAYSGGQFNGGTSGVFVDAQDNIYVTPYAGTTIIKIPAGGGPQVQLGSGLDQTAGVAVDSTGNVYVADGSNGGRIIRIAAGGGPQTTVGSGFSYPQGVGVDRTGNVYVGDSSNKRLVEVQYRSVNFNSRNVCSSGQTTPAPCSQTATLNFNLTAGGTLGTPKVLTEGAANLDFTLANGSTCAGAVATGAACTVNVTFAPKYPGLRRGVVQIVNSGGAVIGTTYIYGVGVGPEVAFDPGAQTTVGTGGSWGVAVDALGTVFVSNSVSGTLSKITPDGTQTTLLSGQGNIQLPAVDGAGNVYLPNEGSGRVLKFSPDGTATDLVTGLQGPRSVAVDGAGNVFVSERGATRVTKIASDGTRSNLGNGLSSPFGLAIDAAGNVFVADGDNGRVVKLAADGSQTTISSGLVAVAGLAVDAAGNVFVASFAQAPFNVVTEIRPDGTTATIGSGFATPHGIAVDVTGNLFVADISKVTRIQRSQGSTLSFADTTALNTSSDSPRNVTVSNIGNNTLSGTVGAPSNTSFTVASGGCGSTLSLLSGVSCNLSYSFTPLVGGPLSGSATITDNSLNVTAATQTITLQGTGLKTSQTITFGSIANQTVGGTLGLSASASSGLTVSFASLTTTVCSVNGTTASLIATGQCTIQATQAGNATYNAATQVSQSFQVNKASQTITFGAIVNQTVGGTLALSAGASSSLTVSFASLTTTVCTVNGTTASFIASGQCTIQATQAGNATYNAATPVSQSFQVNKVAQTINFGAIANQTVGGTLALSAIVSSGLGVSFTSLTTTVCTVNGATASLILAGACTIQATQAGNATYAAATPVSQSFQVNGAPIVTGQTPGVARNNFTGFVGFQFAVGSTPINVFALGRFYVPGNTGTHVVKLVNANGTDVPGGSTTVSEVGGVQGQYKFGNLAGTVTLQANTTYFVVSQESAGGDQFYDYGPITIASGVTVRGPAYADTSNAYNTVSTLPGQAYGPVSFLFGSQSSALSAAITSPAANATVSGNNVPVIVSAGGPVTTLQLQVDGANKGNPMTVAANQSSPYTLSLDTTTLSNAQHQLSVIVSDSQGNSATSSAVAVTVNNAPPASATSFISTQTPGPARNNFTGFVGMQFTVGSTPLSVNSVGRLFLTGNTGSHLLKLVNATTNVDVPGGSVTVTLAGGTAGQYRYGLLASAVTLQANNRYYLLSQETANGDLWDDLGPVTPTGVATVNGPAYVDGNGNYTPITTLPGNAYGPVNFTYAAATSALSVSITSPAVSATVSGNNVQVIVSTGGPVTSVQLQVDATNVGPPSVTPPYTLTFNTSNLNNGAHILTAVASNGGGQSVTSAGVSVTVNNGAAPNPTPFVTSQTPGAARNNFTGFVGLSFTVGSNPITVTQLGRIYLSGNSGTHTMKLVNGSTGVDVLGGSIQLSLSGGTPGQFKYGALTSPVTLLANTTYYVLSLETAGGDSWYDLGPVTTTGAARVNGPTYVDGNNAYVVISTLPNYAYGPVSFTY